MKVTLATYGSRGDVQPFILLSRELIKRGHDVTLCAPPDFADWAASHAIHFIPLGPAIEAGVREIAAIIDRPIPFFKMFSERIQEGIPEQFQRLTEIATGSDALITASLVLSGPSIAEYLKIPHLYTAFCPGILPSSDHPFIAITSHRLPKWINRLSWQITKIAQKWQFAPMIRAERQKLGLPNDRVSGLDVLYGSDRILLASDPAIAPIPSDLELACTQTGYWMMEAGEELEPELLQFIELGSPPIYIGFGSMASSEGQRLTKIIIEAIARSGMRGVISQGWADLGQGQLPENCYLVGNVSHARLFPRMAAIVNHGGAGTTASALRAGVPQIIVPHLLDQFYWGDRLWRKGVSPKPIPVRKLNADNLVEGLTEVVGSAHYRDRAQAIAQALIPNGVERAAIAIEEALKNTRGITPL